MAKSREDPRVCQACGFRWFAEAVKKPTRPTGVGGLYTLGGHHGYAAAKATTRAAAYQEKLAQFQRWAMCPNCGSSRVVSSKDPAFQPTGMILQRPAETPSNAEQSTVRGHSTAGPRSTLDEAVEDLSTRLSPDEVVVTAALGSFEMPGSLSRQGCFAVTNSRLVFLPKKLLRRREIVSVSYADVTSAAADHGIRHGKVELHLHAGRARLTWVSEGDVNAIARAISERMDAQNAAEPGERSAASPDGGSGPVTGSDVELEVAATDGSVPVPESDAPPDGRDPVERLRALGALRDEGLLTEEEFQAKKADILDRL